MRTAKEIFIEGSIPILLKEGTIKNIDEANAYFDKAMEKDTEFINTIFGIINQARKETVEECAERSAIIYHDGFHKTNSSLKYFQSGADNLQPDKESILKIINELK